MSRVLAELLGADEPVFRLGLQQLEQAAGLPRADIRLAVEIEHEVRRKIEALGLDPGLTSGPELFRALEERLKHDETQVRSALGLADDSSAAELLAAVRDFLVRSTKDVSIFAVKPTAMRTLLKKLKPKATMKALGYRSMDSMFKHEPIVQLLAATQMAENADWQQARLQAYGKLQAKDFELRKISVLTPTGKQWPALARAYAAKHRHNMVVLPEVGGMVMVQLPVQLPGLAVLLTVLGLHAIDDLRARSALLKLQQVRPDFGMIVRSAVSEEPMTELTYGGQRLAWKFIHWFYGSKHAPYYPEVFEPHLQAEDFAWQGRDEAFASLHVDLAFWQDSHMLGLLDGDQTVSLNILDVALGLCNGLHYPGRLVHHMREALGRELLARYMHHDALQSMIEETLGRELAPEMALDLDA